MPASTVALHLFSRLPPTIANPYQRTGISAKQFSQWMDQHTQADVMRSIADTLAAADRSAGDPDVFALLHELAAL